MVKALAASRPPVCGSEARDPLRITLSSTSLFWKTKLSVT